jgi:hypothetical protein
MKTVYLIGVVCLLSACVTSRINTSSLQLGMNKQQAINALHLKGDGVVVAKQSPDGDRNLEILQFSQYAPNQMVLDRYWLAFINDKLIEWRRTMPGQKPDMVVEMNVKKP